MWNAKIHDHKGHDNLSRQKMNQSSVLFETKHLDKGDMKIRPYGNWHSPVLPQLSRG